MLFRSIALATIWLLAESTGRLEKGLAARIAGTVLTAGLGYVAAGSLVRLLFLDDVTHGHMHNTVVIAAALAGAAGVAVFLFWRRAADALAFGGQRLPRVAAAAILSGPLLIDGMHVGVLHVAVFCGNTRGQLMGQAWRQVELSFPDDLYRQFMTRGMGIELRVPTTAGIATVKAVVYDPNADLLGSTTIRLPLATRPIR